MNLRHRIIDEKIIVIIRGVYGDILAKTVEALHDGGVNMVEVTFDQALGEESITKTHQAIKMLVEKFPKMSIGAGTVLTVEQVRSAYDAGAKYIISPNVNKDVILETKKLNLISIPGAITPSEIVEATTYGADFVKIFPAKQLGLGYIKDIMAPLNHVKFLAAAGINRENINDYIDVGYTAFGISGDLLRKDLIELEDFDALRENAKRFLSKIK